MYFTVDLPLPPSANEMFVHAHVNSKFGKSFSEGYKRWRNSCGLYVKSEYAKQGSPIIDKPYGVHIRLNINHKSDIDNRCKAILDLLTKNLPIPGDQWINRLMVERDMSVDAATVEVVSLPSDARSIGDILKPIMARCEDMQLLHLLIQSKPTASEKKQTILKFVGSLSDEEVTLLIQAYGLETA